MNYLVVGIGNIGAEYEGTRHNVGFSVLDAWAQASNISFSTRRYGSVAEISFKGHKFTLLKPSTYVNLSGTAVRFWMQKCKIPVENLIVVVDDLALPFGTLRLRKQGSAGGHHGLESIDDYIDTNAYARLRLGIGNGFPRGGQVDYVLGHWTEDEKRDLPEILDKAVEAVKAFGTEGIERAMNRFNINLKKPAPSKPEENQ